VAYCRRDVGDGAAVPGLARPNEVVYWNQHITASILVPAPPANVHRSMAGDELAAAAEMVTRREHGTRR
jgi:hypothetical protein